MTMTQSIRALVVILSTGVVMAAGSAHAEIYHWVDEKGISHYGDRPDAGAEKFRVRHGKPVKPIREDLSEDEEMQKLKADQCQLAKARHAQYSKSSRIVEKDDFGKERELSSEERLETIARAKNDVESYCE